MSNGFIRVLTEKTAASGRISRWYLRSRNMVLCACIGFYGEIGEATFPKNPLSIMPAFEI